MSPTQNLNNIFFSEDDIHEKPYDELLTDVQTFITDNHAREITAEGDEAEKMIRVIIGRYLDSSKVRVETLVYTTQGKASLAVCALIIFLSFIRIMKLSKPIEYKGV